MYIVRESIYRYVKYTKRNSSRLQYQSSFYLFPQNKNKKK